MYPQNEPRVLQGMSSVMENFGMALRINYGYDLLGGMTVQMHLLQVTSVKRRPRRWQKIARVLLAILCVLVLGVLIAVPPVVMGPMVDKHVDFTKVYAAEDYGLSAEKLTLKTDDGLNISAFRVHRDNPRAVVIFISGIHGPSVTAFFGHAKMLADRGYASVLFDTRAHGESDGNRIGLGYEEWQDTKAVVDYIQSIDEYADVPTVVFGVSMGGAIAINSIAQIPQIDGLISMSAYSSWPDVFCDNMVTMGAPAAFAWVEKPFVSAYVMLKYGIGARNMTPINQISNLGDRPALFIHSDEDSQVPFASFERLMRKAPEHVESWVRDGDLHMICKDYDNPLNDAEYAERILSFLAKHFD